MRKPSSIAAITAAAALALAACGGVENTSGGGSSDGDYPTGAVEMPVGASAGGSSDLISREISRGLSKELGGTFPVINREGANGALAAAEVAKAKADGSTISVQNASLFTITPLAVGEDEVTSIDDFDVVQGVSRDDYVLVASKGSGFTSVKDLRGCRRQDHLRHHRSRHRRPAGLRADLQQRRRPLPRPFRSTAVRPRSPPSSVTRSTLPACRSARPWRTSSPARSCRSASSAPSVWRSCLTCRPRRSRASTSRSRSTVS